MHHGRTLFLLLLMFGSAFSAQEGTINTVLYNCFKTSKKITRELDRELKKTYFLQLESEDKEIRHNAMLNLATFFANFNLRKESYYYPLYASCFHGSYELVTFFIGYTSLSLEDLTNSEVIELDEYGVTPFLYACKSGNKKLIKKLMLLNRDLLYDVNNEGENWLHVVAQSDNLLLLCSLVKYLYDDKYYYEDIDFNNEDYMGRTVLSCLYGCKNSEKTLQLLQDHGANFDQINQFNETPKQCYEYLLDEDNFNKRYCVVFHTEYVPDERSNGFYLKPVHIEERAEKCQCSII
jgi:ankyrin repeat protein